MTSDFAANLQATKDHFAWLDDPANEKEFDVTFLLDGHAGGRTLTRRVTAHTKDEAAALASEDLDYPVGGVCYAELSPLVDD